MADEKKMSTAKPVEASDDTSKRSERIAGSNPAKPLDRAPTPVEREAQAEKDVADEAAAKMDERDQRI